MQFRLAWESKKKRDKTNEPFNRAAVEHILSKVRDTVVEGDDNVEVGGKRRRSIERKAQYLMGYTVAAPNCMASAAQFTPISSMDCGTCSTGVLVVRSAKDANRNVHPLVVSRLAAPEGCTAIRAHCRAEKFLLGQDCAFGKRGSLTIMDGGHALRSVRAQEYPNSSQMFCARHFRKECQRYKVSKEDMETYERLLKIGTGQTVAAEFLYKKLSPNSHILSKPKNELFPVFLPKGVYNHGETCNQSAEVCMMMLQSVRRARTYLTSIMALESILRQRHTKLMQVLTAVKGAAVAQGQEYITTTILLEPWPSTPKLSSHVPAVHAEWGALMTRANQKGVNVEEMLHSAEGSLVPPRKVYTVEHPPRVVGGKSMSAFKWTVDLEQVRGSAFAFACGCGKHGTSTLACEDVAIVLQRQALFDEKKHVKPFLTAESWQVCIHH